MGQSPQGFSLHSTVGGHRLAAPSGLGPHGDLTFPSWQLPWEQLCLGKQVGGVQLLLLCVIGARYRGTKGFVLVERLRHRKGTVASGRAAH